MDYLVNRGKHCFIVPPSKHAFKIFDAYPLESAEAVKDVKWGDDPSEGTVKKNNLLTEATIIQNYAWWHGLAPRVYAIHSVLFNKKFFAAQELDYATGIEPMTDAEAMPVYEKVINLGSVYGFQNLKKDCSPKDVIGEQLIDFNTFHFTEDHKEVIRKIYYDQSIYGKIYYHNVPEFGLNKSPRSNEDRIGYMGLDRLDFKDKSVVDLGCAGGFFTRYAKDQGASYVMGLDNARTAYAAFIISNELGYWDIDYKGIDLVKDQYPDVKVDIMLYLSINFHIEFPEQMFKMLKKDSILVVEDNAKDRETNLLQNKIGHLFEKIEKVGISKDHGDKINYHCTGYKL